MKIFYGITKSNFGGAQRYVFDLATHVESIGHRVSVLSGGDGPLNQKLRKEKVHVIAINSLERDISFGKEWESFKRILKILKVERPDVFHLNSSKMAGLGVLAGRIAGIKRIIFTSHAWAWNERRPWWQKIILKFIYWIIILLSHKTICVSEETRRQVAHFLGVRKKLVVVRNGIGKFTLFPTADRDMLNVGAVGELHHIKGFDILLRAWQKFIERQPNAKLIIMGEGEERGKLERLAQELGVSDSVEFQGYVDNARAELLQFDILVMPSRSENLPYALLEAGVAKLPVIASRVGGIPEIIESSVNGVLVDKENPDALFSSLVLLAEDESLRKRLGNNLRSTVEKEFTLEKMVHATLETYK